MTIDPIRRLPPKIPFFRGFLPVLVLVVASACQVASPWGPTPDVGGASGTDAAASALDGNLARCVAEVNRLRATVSLPPLQRSAALETFAATVAEYDAAARQPHAYFRSTNGAGVALAETQILWWRGFTIPQVITRGLEQMWAVGPGGSHYDILTGPYSEVGCGIYVSNGEVTVVQDFR